METEYGAYMNKIKLKLIKCNISRCIERTAIGTIDKYTSSF